MKIFMRMDMINKSSQHLSSTIDDFIFSLVKIKLRTSTYTNQKNTLSSRNKIKKTKEIKIIENYQSVNVLNLEKWIFTSFLNIINN